MHSEVVMQTEVIDFAPPGMKIAKSFMDYPTSTPLFSVYGSHGFIGSEICKDVDFIHNEPNKYDFKNKFPADYPDIVYCISTVHNYHVLDNNPYVDIATNLNHLMSVLQANRLKYGNDFTITFTSSWFVYGDVPLPAKEDAHCDPKGFYSITKRAAEQLLISYCETYDIKWKIVRLCNVLGEDDTKTSFRKNALQHMVKTLCEGGEIHLYDKDCKRDYLHVEDVADAIRLVSQDGNFGEIYNIGSGVGTSVHHLVNIAHRISEYEGNIVLVPVPEFHKTVQVVDMWMDNTKILELGWTPKYTVETVVENLCKFYSGG
jgi:nucleoside-diphosphate-sugar epimerase